MSTLLPNCLTREPQEDRSIQLPGRWLRLYCASCGVDGGRVRDTEMPSNYAFYLCDEKQNNCVEKYGHLDGTFMIPDEVFFEKVKQAQLESYGHILSQNELAMELQDESSTMSKLKKETL